MDATICCNLPSQVADSRHALCLLARKFRKPRGGRRIRVRKDRIDPRHLDHHRYHHCYQDFQVDAKMIDRSRKHLTALVITLCLASLSTFSQSSSVALSATETGDASAKKKETKKERKERLNPQVSPPPSWPPKGFKETNGIYAKIPSKKELAGLVSAKSSLFEAIRPCADFACGSVIVASQSKCLWWEVLSTVTGPRTGDTTTTTSYGSLTTKSSGTDSKAQKVILLISSEPIADGVRVTNINVTCHRSGAKGKSGNTYLPFPDRQ